MIKLIFSLIAAAGLAAACASVPSDKPKGAAKFASDARLGDQVDKICFQRNIDSFSQNDRDTVIVRSGVSKHYLIEVRGVCTNLRRAQTIAIDSHLSCIRRNDALIVSTSAFSLNDGGIGPERCLISGIYEWNKDAEKTEEDESLAEDAISAP